MTNSELCENCGHQKKYHRYNSCCGDSKCTCKKFTPKIEKTEVQTICPLGETIPDFTQEIEKFKENNQTLLNEASENLGEDNNHTAEIRVRVPSKPERKEHVLSNSGVSSNWQDTVQNKGFSTPNCEICKDYPKEYWCGNPKNKVSLKEQENKDFKEMYENALIKIDEQWKLLSTLQEKIEEELGFCKNRMINIPVFTLEKDREQIKSPKEIMQICADLLSDSQKELQKIFKEMGQ